MKILYAFLLLVSCGFADNTFTVTQVALVDCWSGAAPWCGYRFQDGDTTIASAWTSTGTTLFNGNTIPGSIYLTGNDANATYDGSGNSGYTGSCGNNIIWFRIVNINMSLPAGSVWNINCMPSFGGAPGVRTWEPAASGTCYAGDTANAGSPSGCDWKSQGMICVDNICYLNMFRQERADGLHAFWGHDSTLIKTSNGGATWLNAAHNGGTPVSNGDAPAGPGDSTYPASILWPDPAPHNGVSQKMARMQFIQYGQDGATWPSVDDNATYFYSMSYDGAFSKNYLARFNRACMSAGMSASCVSYYAGGTWSSDVADATVVAEVANTGLGGVMYSAHLGTYIATGGNIGAVNVLTAPHPWGPWTVSGSMAYSPSPLVNLGFVSPILATETVIDANTIEFTVSATTYNHSGSGTLAYLTYRVRKSGSGFTGLYPLPSPLKGASGSGAIGVVSKAVTSTQAVLSYNAPNTNPCTVEVSESNTYSPLVHDVDETLFPGSSADTRSASVITGTARQVVLGARLTQQASDTLYYSRALQANTTHYYRITCGTETSTGSFATASIPLTSTYQDIPQMDPASPGDTIMPTLIEDRTQTIVDPHTGALIRRVSLPEDTNYYGESSSARTGPFLWTSGAPRVCGTELVGPDNGYLCTFPNGDGGPAVNYYIIPSTGEARFLGWVSGGSINTSDNKYYSSSGAAVVYKTYAGNFAAKAHDYNFSTDMSAPTTLIANLETAILAFDPTFDNTNFSCGPGTSVGDFIHMLCWRGVQDSNAYVGAIRISTASVVALTRFDDNERCRWCAVHQIVPMGYDEPMFQIIPHYYTGGGVGGGPYITTLAADINNSTTTITVAGEPACAACGTDTSVPLARVGDHFQLGSEIVKIATKVSPTEWTVLRAQRGTSAAAHTAASTVTAACDMTLVHWKFLDDPHGTDTTNTSFVQDFAWSAVAGHNDATTGLMLSEAGDGWVTRAGDLTDNVGQPPTAFVTSALTFAGAPTNCYGNSCRKHPSVGPAGSGWFTDFAVWDFVGTKNGADTMSNVSGSLYKLVNTVGSGLNPKHLAIAGVTGATWQHGGLPKQFLDVSPATIGTTSTDNYKMCIANATNECYAGSVKGELYLNVPGTPSLKCDSASHVCIANYSPVANGVLQASADGTKRRVLTGGLVGLRFTNDYPTAKTLADGSHILFAFHDVVHYPPSQVLMVKAPDFSIDDGVDRTTFIRSSLSITAPTGLGVATAAVEFGYLENGTVSQHYCTSRKEACVAVASTVTDATPFYYVGTDTYTRASCATSCTITLPVLPNHLAYYTVKFYDAGGSLVATGASGVAGDVAH